MKRKSALSDNARAGVADLARWFGVSAQAIQQMITAGRLTRGVDGKFDLQQSVRGYIAELKARQERSANSIDKETAYWKLQNIKQKNRDWRIQRDRMVATEIVKALTSTLQGLRTVARDYPDVIAAIDAAIAAAGEVDVDLVSMAVEGDAEDED